MNSEDFDATDLAAVVPAWLGVTVSLGPVPQELPGGTAVSRWMVATDDAALVSLGSGARLLATSSHLTVEPNHGATFNELSYLLYSWGTRLVLSLRRQFSLHASAFLIGGDGGDRAVAVIGHSRAGKSTTLLGLHERGYVPVVDDLLAVAVPDEGPPRCSGWPRPVHVRAATADQMPQWQEADRLPGSLRADTPRLASVVSAECVDVPLVAGIVLRPDPDAEEVSVEPLAGALKLSIVKATTDRLGHSTFAGRDADFFRWASGLVSRTPMYRITRPTSTWCLDSVLDSVESLLPDGSGQPRVVDLRDGATDPVETLAVPRSAITVGRERGQSEHLGHG